MRRRAGAVGGDPVGQRPDVVHVRLRDLPGRRGVVPDQPAQRGGREPRAARPLRLHRPAVPGVVRAAGRGDRAATCPSSRILVCLDGPTTRSRSADLGAVPRPARRRPGAGRPNPVAESGVDDLAMIVGTGGTTGRPKGVMLTNANLETMTALTLMGYPFDGPPGVPRPGSAHPRGRRAVLPGARARRRDRDHARARRRRLPGARRAAPGDAHVPAADADLHGARPRGARHDGPLARCSASGTAPRRCRRPGSRRRSRGSGR